MKEIELPIISSSTDLSVAIDSLKQVKRSALLAEDNKQYRLYSAGDIVSARKKGGTTLADLPPVESLHIPTEKLKIKSRLFSGGTSYALVEIHHDTVADRYVSSPKDYYCDGPRHHDDFPPPYVSEGDDCPHGDGYKVISSK